MKKAKWISLARAMIVGGAGENAPKLLHQLARDSGYTPVAPDGVDPHDPSAYQADDMRFVFREDGSCTVWPEIGGAWVWGAEDVRRSLEQAAACREGRLDPHGNPVTWETNTCRCTVCKMERAWYYVGRDFVGEGA